MDYMDAEEIRAIFKFSSLEKHMISSFEIREELFLPFLLSLKSGGSWSYASEETKSIAVKDVITYYSEESKTGYTLEKIYLFIEPEIHKKRRSGFQAGKVRDKRRKRTCRKAIPFNPESEKDHIRRGKPGAQENNSSGVKEKTYSTERYSGIQCSS